MVIGLPARALVAHAKCTWPRCDSLLSRTRKHLSPAESRLRALSPNDDTRFQDETGLGYGSSRAFPYDHVSPLKLDSGRGPWQSDFGPRRFQFQPLSSNGRFKEGRWLYSAFFKIHLPFRVILGADFALSIRSTGFRGTLTAGRCPSPSTTRKSSTSSAVTATLRRSSSHLS